MLPLILFYCLKWIKIASKDRDSYFRGLWWLIKQSIDTFWVSKRKKLKKKHSYLIMGLWWLIKRSMTLFKSWQSYRRWHSKKVSWVALLTITFDLVLSSVLVARWWTHVMEYLNSLIYCWMLDLLLVLWY